MASDLTVLIRLHKHELDEKRRALGELYFSLAQVDRERQELERTFALEKEAVEATGDVYFSFAKYVEKVRRQRKDLDARHAGLVKQIEAAKESMMLTFSELKKFEITQEDREKLVEGERLIRENKALDEIALEIFRRKDDE
jgi:flagellar export protein FliJ